MVRIITNNNIKDAVNLWCDNKDEAIKNYGYINDWFGVSNVTDMSNLFKNKSEFNDDISKWDVSNVTNMNGMFNGAKSFNQPLNNWDVSQVTDMNKMFKSAESFNKPINKWNVSNVTDMYAMFCRAESFNQPINNWLACRSNVKDMTGMFQSAGSFNQPLNNWKVSNVTSMYAMFSGAESFNQPINDWIVSNVENMCDMFYDANSFNQDLSSWNIDYEKLGIYESVNNESFLSEELDEINVEEISTQLAKFKLDKECHICQNTETNNNIVEVNCCNNNYHKDCLIKWLNINKTCPTCRNEF